MVRAHRKETKAVRVYQPPGTPVVFQVEKAGGLALHPFQPGGCRRIPWPVLGFSDLSPRQPALSSSKYPVSNAPSGRRRRLSPPGFARKPSQAVPDPVPLGARFADHLQSRLGSRSNVTGTGGYIPCQLGLPPRGLSLVSPGNLPAKAAVGLV